MIKSRVMKKTLRAFENKDFGVIQSLVVYQHVNPNALIPGKDVSLLHLIIGHQSESFAFKITKLFLRCGGDPNVPSSDGVTPTHVAAAWGRNRILHLLLINGGDPWMQDDEKKNAFNYAFEEREWNTIELLYNFQKMHCCNKQELEPKHQEDLGRIIVRPEENLFPFSPIKSMKSMMTQTQINSSSVPSSPIKERIRQFEPNIGDTRANNSKQEEEKIGWPKDFYQTSCEVVVHCDASNIEKKQDNKTFVSRIHIETSPNTSESVEKSSSHQPLDVRGQLMVELQEAVQRRSRRPRERSTNSDEVACLYGTNFESSTMLKSMSEFATKVMKEMEATEQTSHPVDRTVDLCASSPDVTNNYLSCEEEPYTRSVVPPCQVPQSDSSNIFLTPYNSSLSNGLLHHKSMENSNDSFVSVTEDQKEQGLVFVEKKFLLTPTISNGAKVGEGKTEKEVEDVSTASSETSTNPSCTSYSSDILRCELTSLGYKPGPVTKTTKKLYLKKLSRLKKIGKRNERLQNKSPLSVFSSVLEKSLTSLPSFEKIQSFRLLEEEMCRSFDGWSKQKWRQGTNKTSFNYLLLDPRISLDLPGRAPAQSEISTWRTFLSSVFYVGKGKRSRPHAHLHQATTFWHQNSPVPPDKKTEKIADIWKEGYGVVCLQLFQNIIPVEALTREAAMIDAMGLSSLSNLKAGEYYGVASGWSARRKAQLGAYLLHKAMLIFLHEGERQIRPYDID